MEDAIDLEKYFPEEEVTNAIIFYFIFFDDPGSQVLD